MKHRANSLRASHEFICRAISEKSSAKHDSDSVGQSANVAQNVTREQHRLRSVTEHLDNTVEELLTHDWIKSRRGFIHHEYLRFGRKSQKQRQLGEHPLGERLHFLIWRKAEVYHPPFANRCVPSGIKCLTEAYQLTDSHPTVCEVLFRYVADLDSARPAIPARIKATHAHLSA